MLSIFTKETIVVSNASMGTKASWAQLTPNYLSFEIAIVTCDLHTQHYVSSYERKQIKTESDLFMFGTLEVRSFLNQHQI